MSKKPNVLREYHLLIIRNRGGFSWEVRYNRHAKPVRVCHEIYPSQDEANRHGQIALDAIKEELNAST